MTVEGDCPTLRKKRFCFVGMEDVLCGLSIDGQGEGLRGGMGADEATDLA